MIRKVQASSTLTNCLSELGSCKTDTSVTEAVSTEICYSSATITVLAVAPCPRERRVASMSLIFGDIEACIRRKFRMGSLSIVEMAKN